MPQITFTRKDIKRYQLEKFERKMRWKRIGNNYQVTVFGLKIRVKRNEAIKLANWIISMQTRAN